MQKEHETHTFLFDDSENKEIKEKENIINSDINEFVSKFQDGGNSDNFAEYVEKIAISIEEFKENYYTLLKHKIREILNK